MGTLREIFLSAYALAEDNALTRYVMALAAPGVALARFFSMFRGWGIWFIGGLAELLVILLLPSLLIRRLFQRAFRAAA